MKVTLLENSIFTSSFPRTDYLVSRLHYKFTCLVLVASSVFIFITQYLVDPIQCQTGGNIPSDFINSWCWSKGTFSVNKAWKKQVGEEVPYPGVDYYMKGDDVTYHSYYKWVPVVLLLQAVLFYLPRYFWNSKERGRIKNLVMDLNCPVLCEETSWTSRKYLVQYFVTHLHKNEWYFNSFAFAEVLNFVNVFGQLFLMDKFLGNKFLTYGLDVIKFATDEYFEGYNPIDQLFPLLTKCTFYQFGASGAVQIYSSVCLLPLNAYNQKLYIVLWFWFVLLSILSGFIIIYHILSYMSSCVRLYKIFARDTSINMSDLQSVLQWFSVGDWFVLNLLSMNMDSVNFQNFLADLSVTLNEKRR